MPRSHGRCAEGSSGILRRPAGSERARVLRRSDYVDPGPIRCVLTNVLRYPEKLGRHGVGFLRRPDELGRHGVGLAQADRLDVIRCPEELSRHGVGFGEARGALSSRGGVEGCRGKQNRHHRRQRHKFARIHLGLLFQSNRLLMLEGRHLRRLFAVRTSGSSPSSVHQSISKTGARKNETFLRWIGCRRRYRALGLRFPACLNSAAHAGWSSGCLLLRQDRIRPPPGAMPLQNFSASALHSSRTLSAFSARAFIPSRHAGETSASRAFMHFAIAPCPGLTSPHNLLTSAAHGPSLRCWALASAATPATNSTNTDETNVVLIDMVPPKIFLTLHKTRQSIFM